MYSATGPDLGVARACQLGLLLCSKKKREKNEELQYKPKLHSGFADREHLGG